MTSRVLGIEQSLTLMDGRFTMRVSRCLLNDDAVSVEYTLTPALPEPVEGDRPLVLFVNLADDIGTDYASGGGAHGPTQDGSRTEGVATIYPAPPSHADQLFVNVYLFEGSAETSTPVQLAIPLSAS